MGERMFVELKTGWRGFPAGHRLDADVIGGGVADLLCRMNYAEVINDEPDEPTPIRTSDRAERSSGDAASERPGDDRRGQAAAKYRGKR
jgi:hypothetical protein